MISTPHTHTTMNNAVEYFIDGERIFPAMIQLLESAERSIELETFLFRDDESGRAISAKLVEKAKCGLDVKVLISDRGLYAQDSFGIVKGMMDAGVKVRISFPFPRSIRNLATKVEWLSGHDGVANADVEKEEIHECRVDPLLQGTLARHSERLMRRFLQGSKSGDNSQATVQGPARGRLDRLLRYLSLYDHRKLIVVDDRCAIMGGMNIGNDFLFQGPPSALGYYHDIGLKVTGGAVLDLAKTFRTAWALFSGEAPTACSFQSKTSGHGLTVTTCASFPRATPNPIRQAYIDAFRRAKQRILIVNLFLSEDGVIQEVIRAAQRGVQVDVISTFLPVKSLHGLFSRIIYLGYWYLIVGKYRLHERGVRLHQYTKHQVHAKVGLTDNEWVTVGSCNLDNSSLHRAMEINVILRDGEIVERLSKDLFLTDMQHSRPLVTEFSLIKRMVYFCCYLIYRIADEYVL